MLSIFCHVFKKSHLAVGHPYVNGYFKEHRFWDFLPLLLKFSDFSIM